MDAHLSRGLDPVEIDVFDRRICGDHGRETQRDLSDLAYIWTAHAVLNRPPHRWTQLKGRNPRYCAWKLLGQDRFESLLKPVSCFQILRYDDRLGKEVVRELDVEGQIEADRSPAHIGAPAFDVRITFQEFVELC